MRVLTRAAAAGAATMMLAAGAVAVTAAPANAATANYYCDSGSYKPATGRLGAFTCTGSGSTNVYVGVSVLDVVNGPIDVPATLFCTDFGLSGVPGHWAGNCVVSSYP